MTFFRSECIVTQDVLVKVGFEIRSGMESEFCPDDLKEMLSLPQAQKGSRI